MIIKVDQSPDALLGRDVNIREIFLWENVVLAAYQNHGLA